MLSKELPLQLDVTRLCKQAKQQEEVILSGMVKVSNLSNLKDFLQEQSGDIELQLSFRVDGCDIPYIKGTLKANLVLLCERCLGPMNYVLDREFLLSPVESMDAASKCPEAYEPVLVTEGMLSVIDCVTEEILLSLPLVSKHEIADCNLDLADYLDPEIVPEIAPEIVEETTKRPNPFSVLKELRKD